MPSKITVSRGIRFPRDMYQELGKRAKAQRETLNDIVVRLLQEKLNSASKDVNTSF